jgi:hypothetical protein
MKSYNHDFATLDIRKLIRYLQIVKSNRIHDYIRAEKREPRD